MRTILIILIFASALHSQWVSDFRVSNDPQASRTSENNAWCITKFNGLGGAGTMIVWYDNRDGNQRIYRRMREGGNWSNEQGFTDMTQNSSDPSIFATSYSDLNIVWSQNVTNYGFEIFHFHNSITRLTYDPAFSGRPCVKANGSVVHVVWEDERNGSGNMEIYYKRSSDAGSTWGPDTRLTNAAGASNNPCLAVDGNNVYLVWEDYREVTASIYFKKSPDDGLTWSADTKLTSTGASYKPCIANSGANIHLTWHDNRDGNFEIYYKRTTNGGLNWNTDTRLTNSTGASQYPSIAAYGNGVHIAWDDIRDGNREIYYKRSTNKGITWEPDLRLTYNTALSVFPSIAVYDTLVEVAWADERDGNPEIYFKENPGGNSIGIQKISSRIPDSYVLLQNYPNPFNPKTIINYQLPNTNFVRLAVYDATGKEVAVLVNEQLRPGEYEVEFDGSNLSSGIYFYKLQTVEFSDVKRMVLIK